MERKKLCRAPAVGGRVAGMTLVEVTVAMTVTIMALGTVSAVFTALTRGTAELQTNLLSRKESERARIALTNDLQLTDTLGSDDLGMPFFMVKDAGDGQSNTIEFRNVEGFVPDGAGGVDFMYSSPVVYEVDAAANLLRTQNGQSRVMANHVRKVAYEVTSSGVVIVDMVMYAVADDPGLDVSNRFQIAPRNTLQM